MAQAESFSNNHFIRLFAHKTSNIRQYLLDNGYSQSETEEYFLYTLFQCNSMEGHSPASVLASLFSRITTNQQMTDILASIDRQSQKINLLNKLEEQQSISLREGLVGGCSQVAGRKKSKRVKEFEEKKRKQRKQRRISAEHRNLKILKETSFNASNIFSTFFEGSSGKKMMKHMQLSLENPFGCKEEESQRQKIADKIFQLQMISELLGFKNEGDKKDLASRLEQESQLIQRLII